MSRRVGVVLFPGSNCEQDMLEAVALVGGEPEVLWHGDATVSGVDAVVVPGGFAHGDRPGGMRVGSADEHAFRFDAAALLNVGTRRGDKVARDE